VASFPGAALAALRCLDNDNGLVNRSLLQEHVDNGFLRRRDANFPSVSYIYS
jgi:hypothetical protein